MNRLFAFWDEIERELSPTFIGNERQLTPVVGVDEDVVLLNALGVVGAEAVKSTFKMSVLWIQADNAVMSGLPSKSTVVDLRHDCLGYLPVTLAVTKSGNLATVVEGEIVVISAVDETVVNSFGDGLFLVAVDSQDRLWTCCMKTKWKGGLLCFSNENGEMVRAIRYMQDAQTMILPHATAIAFMPDGRMVVAGFFHTDSLGYVSRLAVFLPGSEKPDSFISLPSPKERVRHLKVCQQTGEFYILYYDSTAVSVFSSISVFSSTGAFLHTIGHADGFELKGPKGISLTGNGYVLVSEYHGCCVSIWTCAGKFVYRQSLSSPPLDATILPNGNVAVIYEIGEIEIFFW